MAICDAYARGRMIYKYYQREGFLLHTKIVSSQVQICRRVGSRGVCHTDAAFVRLADSVHCFCCNGIASGYASVMVARNHKGWL